MSVFESRKERRTIVVVESDISDGPFERFVDGLQTGESAQVLGLAGGSARRLAEVGFVPGARLEMLRTGDPCIVRVDRARLGLGVGLQREILISTTGE